MRAITRLETLVAMVCTNMQFGNTCYRTGFGADAVDKVRTSRPQLNLPTQNPRNRLEEPEN